MHFGEAVLFSILENCSMPSDRRKMSLEAFHPLSKEQRERSSVSNKIFLYASLMKNPCLFGELVHSLAP